MMPEEQKAMMMEMLAQSLLPLDTIIKVGEEEKAFKIRVYRAKKDGSLIIRIKEAQEEEEEKTDDAT